MTEKTPVAYEIVTEKILAMLEGGTVPWHQPWLSNGLPLSMSTGKPYRGVNPFLLNMSSIEGAYESRFWGTYKSITEHGGQVRKGEHSTIVVLWKRGSRIEKNDEGEDKKKSWAMLRYFRVFCADQADWPDGLPAKFAPQLRTADFDPIVEAQAIFDGYVNGPSGPALRVAGDAAYYEPAEDRITLPNRQRFVSTEDYYSTAFHEATHSTGHKSRLNRDGVAKHNYGITNYGKEELVAEMGAAMLCGLSGIEQVTIEQSAAYLASWLRTIQGDPKLVVAAAGAAQRACDLIQGIVFEQEEAA